MAIIDPHRTWEPLAKRLAETTDERHRVVLGAVIERMKAEAAPDLARLMATLSPNPDYHFWGAEGDFGPKTTAGVRSYYTDFLATRTNILEFEVQRLVVDDHGKILGEDSYNPGMISMTKLSRDELPQQYLDLAHAPA